jgi:glyoxylase-like metal-dependent hydrolase (beta-lactamase superfamily II)
LRVNVVKFAESRRTKNFSVQGAPTEPSVQARTAFQVVYADGTVMVDAGMDRQVHRFFGRGVEEPYDEAAALAVAAANERARLIVLTHEHGDHAGGVIASPKAAELAPKTLLTRAQLNTLTTAPQMPEIRLTAAAASRYLVLDYDAYYPLAPGMALIKAPGHTRGSQMVLIRLESGRDILLAGDVAWHMDGVILVVGKDAPWVTEDKPAVLAELRWLNGLTRTEPNLTIVPSHDDEHRRALVAREVLGDRFE